MQFRNRQSDADAAPDQDQDPLSPYSSPTVRRQVDRGGTQPLETGGTPRTSDTQVGTDFATRGAERRSRQSNARVYPQRFGEMARKVDNRQLMMIGGGLILLLLALLAVRAYTRSRGTAGTAIDAPTASAPAFATAGAGSDLALPSAGPIVTVGPGGLGVDAAPTAAPAAPAGGAPFVVAGTGTEGLFLRSNPSTTGSVVATLPEGTKVQATGETSNDGTRTWRKVRTDKGQEGWVASDFLVAAP